MANYRRGHSYRKPRPRIMIANPVAHRLKGRINELRREIKQAGEIAAHFKVEPVGLEGKQETLETLEQELEKVEA